MWRILNLAIMSGLVCMNYMIAGIGLIVILRIGVEPLTVIATIMSVALAEFTLSFMAVYRQLP